MLLENGGAAPVYRFLDFELILKERALLWHGERLSLGSRAFDVLAALVERPGRLVGKDELIGIVWPDTVVEDGNLRVQISALRKVLNEDQHATPSIVSVPGRGYMFTPTVTRVVATASAPARQPEQQTLAFASPHPQLAGREDAIGSIVRGLLFRRFVSVIGTAGVGKTTAALAAASRISAQLTLPVCVLDASSCGGLSDALQSIASTLGMQADCGALRNACLVVVLDGCEYAIRGAAALAEQLHATLPNLWLLATSRETLHAKGELVHNLGPLALPDATERISAAEARTFAAIQLFCERARARNPAFTMDDNDAVLVADICRELDGVPLAIELAALHMELLNVRELHAKLNDRFQLMSTSLRSAPPRQRSMWAALEWSYDRLTITEKIVLGRLSLFHDRFGVGCAATVACCEVISAGCLAAALAGLVAKSMMLDEPDSAPRYRLLNNIRAFAFRKLQTSSDPLFNASGA